MKNWIIAGGTDGLGLEITKLLIAENQVTSWVLGRNSDKVANLGERVKFLGVDATKPEEIESVLPQIPDEIDGLVISTGIFGHGPLEKFSYKQIELSLNTNLISHIYLSKTFISRLVKGSRIISINSISGVEASKERSLYCAAKWGLRGFNLALAKELEAREIKITQVYPGYFDSDYMDKIGIVRDRNKAIPIQELAKQIVNLCYLSGDVFVSDYQIKNITYK